MTNTVDEGPTLIVHYKMELYYDNQSTIHLTENTMPFKN